ncbi:putative major outer membrane protein C3H-3 [Anaplasma phagocytophilum str. ApNP]|uniref:Putative major outer membrane protein C3H-3 n=1 Tax=Anaplasma phagocytophilum str. ApNP TaxID=1359153 RepID=A0A0F3NK32_ANAPH|nr:putative major outer membrane protein C3H-3 [Anaplasma phagocytophilum str. ApNP]
MKITNSAIDGKVCNGSHAKISAGSNLGKEYVAVPSDGGSAKHTAQCSGLGESDAKTDHKFLSKFVELTKIGEGKNWPTGSAAHNSGNALVNGDTNSNANAMAKDLVALNRDEKTIVAGLLAKTIEGVRLLRLGQFLLLL